MRSIPSSNLLAQAQNILESIQALKRVEQEHRRPTVEEREMLMAFSGFGPLALHIFADPITSRYRTKAWQELGERLQAMLTPEEYLSAKKSTFSAFYTSRIVIQALYAALAHLGVPDNSLILEPGSGSGNFMALAPDGMQFKGIEQDHISGRIAKALYPQHTLRVEPFEQTTLPHNSIDAAIGNPPYADVKLPYWDTSLSLHEFFIAKSIDLLKPGGVLAMVVTHYLMDRQQPRFREQLAERAHFLGAVRLPATAFAEQGTSVITDLLFLQKRLPEEQARHVDPDWLWSAPLSIEGVDVQVNRYFHHDPHPMRLGTWTRQDRLYGAESGFSLLPTGDLATQLQGAISHLHAGIFHAAPSPALPLASTNGATPYKLFAVPQCVTEGSFFLDGTTLAILQVQHGEAVPVLQGGKPVYPDGSLLGRRLAHLIRLRDSARYVLDVQNTGQPPAVRDQARHHLNADYDAFIALYGPVNHTVISTTAKGITVRRMPNLVTFRDDPDAMLVMALEQYDETTGIATKAAIMEQDVVVHQAPITSAQTAEQGLLLSLDQKGRVDLAYIARLTSKAIPDILDELGDLLYQDPDTQAWETADVYLSGNVRAKLTRAEQCGTAYQRNAEALRLVQPEDLLPGNIDVNLGAPWIPATDIHAFACEVFGLRDFHITVAYSAKDALWSIDGSHWASSTVAATAEYGTSRIDGIALLGQALNLQSPTIYNARWEQGKEVRTLDQKETLAAREKQQRIKQRFKEWIFSEPSRAERLVRIYNDLYNNVRLRTFDGAHLRFPGMSPHIQLAKHQVDAVWRIMSAGNTLLAHVVGSGKAQPLNAKILTPTGWKLMGEIHEGDMVIAVDGTPTKVVGVFPQGEKEVYRVLCSDGAETTACGEHLWLTQTSREREQTRRARNKGHVTIKGQPKIRTTEEITKTLKQRHYIPLADSPRLQEETPLPMDAYTLGVLIGNGSFIYSAVRLSVPDATQLDLLTLPDGIAMKPAKKPPGSCPEVFFVAGNAKPNPLMQILRDTGLHGHRSCERFIPHNYLYATSSARLAMLQGLMDTDGGISGRSTSFTSYSEKLAQDVVALARSLGGTASYHAYPGARQGSIRFNVHIHLPKEVCPFRLPRKIEAWKSVAAKKYLRSPLRQIVAIHAIGKASCQCIAVEHASQLYITDDFIVCHNTYAMMAAMMKMKQTGLIHKALIVTPNNLLEQFARECLHLYPNAKLLIATKEDFTQERRKLLTAKMASGVWDGILTTHSSFERISMSRAFQQRFLQQELDTYESLLVNAEEARENARYNQAHRNIMKSLEKQKARYEAKLEALAAEGKKDDGLVFDELGIDYLFYDESQAGKNLQTPTKMQRVAGIQTGGSERAFDLAMKCRYLHEQHPGHGIAFASGTPVSNTMVEMYTIQRYLDPDGLEAAGLEHFDAWAALFGEVVELMEIAPDGKTLRPRSRFARFVNLPELQQMFRLFADVQTAAMLQLPTPALTGGKPAIIACPMSDVQRRLQDALVKRYEAVRNGHVKPWEDNALAITTDGRKLALEARLLLGTAEDEPASKVNALVENVCGIWRETEGRRGTQLVFADMGVHPTAWGYCVYDDVLDKLIKHRLPREQVAMIGDADTDGKKHALFEKVRAGNVRVLLGSTQKMGMGMDVQRRLVALHHLDAPWKPAEVEQREGRILRQGNINAEVAIYRYVTEGSFDAFMWQALETKAKFIAQVITGDSTVRQAEDISEQALSYAEVKAIASGNPAVLTMAETEAALQRLAVLARHHDDEQYVARVKVRDMPSLLRDMQQRLAQLQQDGATVRTQGTSALPFVLNERPLADADALAVLASRLQTLPLVVSDTTNILLGTYLGLQVHLALHPYALPEIWLTGQTIVRTALARRSHGARAILNAVQRLAGEYEGRGAMLAQEIQTMERQCQDYAAQLGKPFALASYRDALTGLRQQLSAALSEHPPQSLPPIEDIVAQITALHAAHKLDVPSARPVSVATVRPAEAITTRIHDSWRTQEPATAPEPLPLFGDMLLAQGSSITPPARRAPRQRRKAQQGQLVLFV